MSVTTLLGGLLPEVSEHLRPWKLEWVPEFAYNLLEFRFRQGHDSRSRSSASDGGTVTSGKAETRSARVSRGTSHAGSAIGQDGVTFPSRNCLLLSPCEHQYTDGVNVGD